jgi:hypothetical protein
MIDNPSDREIDDNDQTLRGPLTLENPGSQAVEPSPEDDEENLTIEDVVEEIDIAGDDDLEDNDEAGDPDKRDVVPGSDADSDDASLGV